MKTKTSILSVLVLLVSGISFAQAEMFKCIDSNGKTKYQAIKCPEDAKASIVAPPAMPVTLKFLKEQGEKIDNLVKAKIKANDELYIPKIANLGKQHLPTKPLENEMKLAVKAIFIEYEKALKDHIVVLGNHEPQLSGKTKISYSEVGYLKASAERKLEAVKLLMTQIDDYETMTEIIKYENRWH